MSASFDIKCKCIAQGSPNFGQIFMLSPGEFELLSDEYEPVPENWTPEPTREEIQQAQSQIAQLQEEMRKLKEQSQKPKEEQEQPDSIPQDLIDDYTKLYGKAPHHRLKAESIREAIASKQEVAA